MTLKNYYRNWKSAKVAPALNSLHSKLIEISKGTYYEFRCKRTSLHHLKETGLQI